MSPKLIGFYQTDDQAQHACEDLASAGFDGQAIHIYHGGPRPVRSEVASPVDRKLYQEATRRGAVAVMLDLEAPNETAHDALEILKRHHPIQMARAAWPGATPGQGWNGSMQPQQRQEQPRAQAQSEAQATPAEAPKPAPAQRDPEQQQPLVFSAKRFAAEIAGDERFRGREWSDIEPFVRKEFEKHYPNEDWDDHCPAIMLGYLRSGEPT